LWMLVLMALSGFSAIGIWVTQMSAAADVIEWDEERTGRRQEGAYGGITSMGIKIATALSLVLVGPVMGWIGYRPGMTELPRAAAENLRTLFAVVPAIIYVLSAVVFARYPITRASHRAMRDRLSARGAPGEEEPPEKSIA
ncbi:MAG: MFS transporter, partial [Candidatus Binataceae bacterium]